MIHGMMSINAANRNSNLPFVPLNQCLAASSSVNTAGMVMMIAKAIAYRQSMKRLNAANTSRSGSCQLANQRIILEVSAGINRRGEKLRMARMAIGNVSALRAASKVNADMMPA